MGGLWVQVPLGKREKFPVSKNRIKDNTFIGIYTDYTKVLSKYLYISFHVI